MIVSPQFLETKEIDFGVFPIYENGNLTWKIDGEDISRNASDFWGANKSDVRYVRYKSALDWYHKPIASQLHDVYSSNHSAFDKLGPKACFEMYNASLLSGHSHSFIVLNSTMNFENMTAEMPGLWKTWTNFSLPNTDMEAMPLFW